MFDERLELNRRRSENDIWLCHMVGMQTWFKSDIQAEIIAASLHGLALVMMQTVVDGAQGFELKPGVKIYKYQD